MNRNWLKTGLLLVTLGAIPVANVWAEPIERLNDTESRDYSNTSQGHEDEDDDAPNADEPRPGKRHDGRRFKGGRRPMPGHGGPHARKNYYPDGDRDYDDRLEGDSEHHDDDRVGPPHDRRERRMSPPGGPHRRGPQGFDKGDEWQRGEHPGRRPGARRGGRFNRGRDEQRDWNRAGRKPGRFHEGGRFRQQDSGRLILGGTVTTVVVDNSIGVKADDGSSFWAKLPASSKNSLRVGQRVELSGEWQDQFFVADSVHPR